jgi:DNA polymerase zeta
MAHFLTCTLSTLGAWIQKKVRDDMLLAYAYASHSPDSIVGAYIYRFHLSVDHALAVSYRRDQYGENAKFVARITLVKGVPFYGFHVGYRSFLKIYMFNPIVMTRLADLLYQGVIMKRVFQPYEAHLQYLLQFMTDYNLYGCGYIDTLKATFRAPIPQYDANSNSAHLWHDRSIPLQNITDDTDLKRVSHCSIEVDICAQDIMNRQMVKERLLHHDFVERIHPISADVKLVYSMAGLWKDETRRRKLRMPNPKSGSSPFPQDALVSMSADPRDSQPQGWIHEEEYRQQILSLITDEREDGGDGDEVSFESFVDRRAEQDTLKTALQSVEDLYPVNLMPALGLSVDEFDDFGRSSSIEVDENSIIKAQGDEADPYPDDSDEDLIQIARESSRESAKGKEYLAGESDYLSKDGISDQESTAAKPSVETLKSSSIRRITSDGSKPKFSANPLGVEGICVSGQITGEMAWMPLLPELIDIAGGREFVTKDRDLTQLTYHEILTKRRRSPGQISEKPLKRTKLESSTTISRYVSTNGQDHGSVTIPSCQVPPLEPSPQPQTKRNVASTSGGKVQTAQTLSFTVVKDQNDPSTKLRLSQLSQKSASQDSFESPAKRQVSFDQKTFHTQDDSSSQIAPPRTPSTSHSLSSETPSSVQRAVQAVSLASHKNTLVMASLPPSMTEVFSTMQDFQLPPVIYQDAYYSVEKDVPPRAREFAGREFRLESNTLPYLPNFDATGASPANYGMKSEIPPDTAKANVEYGKQQRLCTFRSWEIDKPPPTYKEVEQWWQIKEANENGASQFMPSSDDKKKYMSQVDGPTPKNRHGFKYSQKKESTSVQHEAQYMSIMSLEVHVNTRGKFVPNPEEDEVQAIFWCVRSDGSSSENGDESKRLHTGIIVQSEDGSLAQRMRRQSRAIVLEETSELDVMTRMIEIVRTYDPDILTGYEVHGSSWGYLIERARFKYDYNLCDEFSRMKSESHGRFGKENDRWGFNTTSTIRVTGRHMINIWRAMRAELNLLQYSMENVVWHLLHKRIPHYSWRTLTEWYKTGQSGDLAKILRYYQARTRLDLEILESNELIPRTSEQARLLGVDFFSVFSRGSQFKVESIMFRIAKPENFILISPSRRQVGSQNALECLPLVMEPQSAFYNGPLLVLDFQSLYPSVMIAYNYCYSTFLGRITSWRGKNKMGFTEYRRSERLLELLKDHINIAPNGMMYAKTEIRKSLLAKMLTEILETRVMVKSGMKQDKEDKTLQALLNNRQLALKLLANVTYGYTSASFSGRMPCSEIADSIVQTARETLERAIAYIHSIERWGAEVVYGDTDSLFVYLKGRTRDQAFDIGNEIAQAITDMNPRPVKLKFEKVYHPCVLLAKKRYVGYKYESKDQEKPEFDAKGIETVRRDGTPAEQKIEEKALRILFETADLSQVKAYFQKQCEKVMSGAVSVQDFCFAKEVRLGTYSDKGPPPPGALISTKRMLEDARAEPQYGERVPYVVLTGAPGARLVDRCVAPEDLLRNSHCQLDAEYYISKNLIPPLERIFNLVGANVRQWYDEMPKVHRIRRIDPGHMGPGGKGGGMVRKTLESYMKSSACMVCGVKMKGEGSLCGKCTANVPSSLLALRGLVAREERRYLELVRVCQSCSGHSPLDDVPCDSKDCPVFYSRVKQAARLRMERGAAEPVIRGLVEGVDRESLEW